MLALAYDAALRREEVCTLQTGDVDPARRTISIRAENTKNRRARVVPYSEATAGLYAAYLQRLLEGDRPGRAASVAIAARLVNKVSTRIVEVPAGAQPDQLNEAYTATRVTIVPPVNSNCLQAREDDHRY